MAKDAVEALDDFLDLLRREFHDNPELALRAIKALGGKVEFRGGKTADLVNPLELIASNGVESAMESLKSFSPAELKKIAKNHGIATTIDMTGQSASELVELIVRRSSQKIAERRS